ncbi:MAG: M23 family metallopeptidase [Betaproteobacteria bacterium]|nr:M23 family metallopeptidase [Betaproteobacteria bacterium]
MIDHESKTGILPHGSAAQARKKRLRWLVIASSVPLLGILTAFGIAPGTDTTQIPVKTVIEQLELPGTPDSIDAPADTTGYWHNERIERGDTAASVLQRLGVNDEQIARFLKSPAATHALIQIRPGQRIQAEVTGSGRLIWLRHLLSNSQMLEITPGKAGFEANRQQVALETHTIMKSGVIRDSLFGATDAAGIPDAIAMQIADIFSTDIDFHQDLRHGDRFNVIYEMMYHNGEPVMAGRVLAAEFINAGHSYRAVLSDVEGGKPEYYTPDGKPMKKAFLRSPLPFSRISSGFAMRFHPILKKWKQHKGIDYAAPIGTKVMAIADATVAFVGQERGYGNIIVLQHAGAYSTAYGHLSAFAKGLHRGEHVSQGQIIGYVGMTGWATGPHLHYEFRVAGIPTNPLTAKMPSAFPIAAQRMPRFRQMTQPLVSQLELLHDTNLVALE